MTKHPHYAGCDPQVPKPDSRGWKRVVLRGCGGHTYDTPDGPEYDCSHRYMWGCDQCPVGVEMMEAESDRWELEHQRPPRPKHLRDPEKWWVEEVAGDLITASPDL
jgi:hypothetical protein